MVEVLITGVEGFIGSNLVKCLKDKYNVAGVERFSSSYGTEHDIEMYYCDLSYYSGVDNLISKTKPRIVIHLAAISRADRFVYENFEETLNVNIRGTVNLLEALKKVGSCELFVFPSSAMVYGNQGKDKYIETDSIKPNDPYSISKVCAELYVMYAYNVNKLNTVILRFSNTYGKIGRTTLVESLVLQMLENKEYVKVGDPSITRDLLFIDDHISAYLTVLENIKEVSGQVYNVGTGKGTTVQEVVQIAKDITKYKGEIKYYQYPHRPGEITSLVLDSTKFKRLGWYPMYNIKEGIEEMIRRWKYGNS